MPTRSNRTRANAGFTLVELMVVVALIGITAALGSIYLNSDKRGRTAEGFAEKVAGLFEVAQQRAIATQKRQRLIIEADNISQWEHDVTGLGPVSADETDFGFVYETFVKGTSYVNATNADIHLEPNDGLPGDGDGLPLRIDLLPDGRVRSAAPATFYETGWTVFIGDGDDRRYRVILFGMTGTTAVYDNW